MFLPHPRVKVSIVGSLRDREVACSASDRQGSNFESCVWRTVSSQSSHHPQEVLLAQFSLYVHKGGLKPDSFHFMSCDLLRLANEETNEEQQVAAQVLWTTLTNQTASFTHVTFYLAKGLNGRGLEESAIFWHKCHLNNTAIVPHQRGLICLW